MMAVEQKNKVRVIMNLSAPAGASLNDAIDDLALEKVSMSTAKVFGYSVVDCGPAARMWKWDLVDAYKNIPATIQDLRLQAFSWLGMGFVETQKVFGDSSSVAAFDRLGNTLVSLATSISGLPPQLVHRTLDDTPVVTPAASHWGPAFATSYHEVCNTVGARLAPVCPDHDKAFEDSTEGTVLGVRFHTTTLSWSIPGKKLLALQRLVHGCLTDIPLSLLQLQRLLGSLNNFGQMSPFLKAFRHPLILALTEAQTSTVQSARLSRQAIADLQVWANVINASPTGLPIPRRPTEPPLSALSFYSDAAGARFVKSHGRFLPFASPDNRAAVSLSLSPSGPAWFYAYAQWPVSFLLHARDSQDHAYGCKSTTLEAIGLLLPFLCCPSHLANRDIVLFTDNEALVYGWQSRRVRHDVSASIFIRAIHLISAFLNCTVLVRHLPRLSTPTAILADALTRSSTSLPHHLSAVSAAPPSPVPQILKDWLDFPSEDWSLALNLLSTVESLLPLYRN
jgi:hypothetical protein